MNTKNQRESLLIATAQNGDALAFYGVFKQELDELYRNMRNDNVSYEQAMSVLIPFVRNSFRKFVTLKSYDKFRKWFDKQKISLSVTKRHQQENNIELVPDLNTDLFSEQIIIALQREYSRMRNDSDYYPNSVFSFIGKYFLKTVLVIIFLAGLFTAVSFLLKIFSSSVSLTFSSPEYYLELTLPFGGRTPELPSSPAYELYYSLRDSTNLSSDNIITPAKEVRKASKKNIGKSKKSKSVQTVKKVSKSSSKITNNKTKKHPKVINKPVNTSKVNKKTVVKLKNDSVSVAIPDSIVTLPKKPDISTENHKADINNDTINIADSPDSL